MTKLNRFAYALAFCFVLILNVQAQTPTVSTVNVTPDEQRVRISSVGDVLDMRVAVSDEAGDIVFESGPITGEHLDWTMQGDRGTRLPAGSYTLTVTYRTSSGKLRRRVEQVLVTAEAAGKAEEQQSSAPSPTAVGAITGEGAANRVAKFTGPNTIGNSTITEVGGKVGIGVTSPGQSLHVLGASSRLRLQSTGGPSLTTTEYVTNNRLWQTGVGGSTAANGVAGKFFVFDQTASQYRLVVDTAGNFGVGTTAPASKLTVNGQLQILGNGNGIKFPDGSIQTKAIAGTINGTGTANRLAKFTGPNSFGNSSIAEVSGNVGIGTASPVSKLHIVSTVFNQPPRLQATGTETFAAGWDFYHGTTPKGYVGVPGASAGDPAPGEMLLYGSPGVKTTLWSGGARRITLDEYGDIGVNQTPNMFCQFCVTGDISNGVALGADNNALGPGSTALYAATNSGIALGLRTKTGVFIEGYSPTVATRKFHINQDGTYVAGSDFAEALPARGGKTGYEPGDVLVLSSSASGTVEKSSRPFDTRLAGIYSTRPGMIGAEKGGASRVDEDDLPVAIVGIVPTKVSAENGTIRVGDLLTTSSTPGYAMRCRGGQRCVGAIVGKALERLKGSKGIIKVLVMLR